LGKRTELKQQQQQYFLFAWSNQLIYVIGLSQGFGA
jgi:hypothetical protein